MKLPNLRDCQGIIIENRSFRHGAFRNASRIVEGLPQELPLEPLENRWQRKEKFLKIKFEFKNRNLLKDFVASIQELEDRANHFCKIAIDKSSVTIKTEIDDENNVSEVSERFLLKAKQIYENISND